MYHSTYLVLAWMAFDAETQACSVDCGKLHACVPPDGLGADCKGFQGCHEKCPPGSISLEKNGKFPDL